MEEGRRKANSCYDDKGSCSRNVIDIFPLLCCGCNVKDLSSIFDQVAI